MPRFALLLLLVVLIPGAPAVSQGVSVPATQFTLPNGLNVMLHEDHTLPTVAVNLWYRVGSAREHVGRTGFAHLFEHLMFMGSKDVPVGKFDQWLEAAGGDNNASTSNDRTNYFENIPSNALELALFLESDRMGFLVDSMTPPKVDLQRDVVKNERRESYENRPYGRASLAIDEQLFPADYPYHWPVIGSMEDLSAASYQDVVDFFRRYYTPRNASLAIAGDIDPSKTRKLVEKWFRDIPSGTPVAPVAGPPPLLTAEKRLTLEDNVQLPRLYMVWIGPRELSPGTAELDILSYILAGGKNSRLYKRLVYDLQIAQDVSAFLDEGELCSRFYIVTTARQGHALGELEKVVQEEIDRLKQEAPVSREVNRAVNQIEASFLDRLENMGERADQINAYYCQTGIPDYFKSDLARYAAVAPSSVVSATRAYIRDDGRVVISVVPRGKPELASAPQKGEKK